MQISMNEWALAAIAAVRKSRNDILLDGYANVVETLCTVKSSNYEFVDFSGNVTVVGKRLAEELSKASNGELRAFAYRDYRATAKIFWESSLDDWKHMTDKMVELKP